jgi:riboflavin biosynthesis pyrimidine reductase
MVRLETLFDSSQPGGTSLPASLSQSYGGELGLRRAGLVANFVSSLDGVVALDEHTPPSVISAGSDADRFVMGLLRAHASAVLIGAGTLRAEPNHIWTPEFIYPPDAPSFAELRRSLELPGSPRLVVVSARGEIDSTPALEMGALVLTTPEGSARLRRRLPAASKLAVLGQGPYIEPADILQLLRAEGHELVLTEGGPTLLGPFLKADLVDELFLTLSPLLAGSEGAGRRHLVEAVGFDSNRLRRAGLKSVRRSESHLFLRYELERAKKRRPARASRVCGRAGTAQRTPGR